MTTESQPSPGSTPTFKEQLAAFREEYKASIPSILFKGGVPKKFCEADLSSVNKSIASIVKVGQGYFITGPVGAGKTYLAVALLREHLKLAKIWRYGSEDCFSLQAEHRGFVFVSEYEIFSQLRGCYSRHECEDGYMNSLATTPLLIIDDFGTEPSKEWISSKLFRIIDKRSANELTTIISSNLSLEQVAQNVDDRIASRIVEMTTIINMANFPDRRLKAIKKHKPKEQS